MKFSATVLFGLLLTASCAHAQVKDLAQPPDGIRAEYVACLYAGENDPAFGLEKGQGMVDRMRADAQTPPEHRVFAEHCIANALFLLERFEESGQLLERMAEQRIVARSEDKADLLVQAGQAYFRAENYTKAIEVQRRAMELRPWTPDMYVDLAYTREALGDNFGVVKDLKTALSLDPDRPDVGVLLASAKRAIQDYEGALKDLNRIILRWPGYPEALLERGMVRRVQGQLLDAEADWLLVLRLHPQSAAAAVALENLNNL